ncbi:MAG: YeeE/YedE family protein [Rhodobacteraceae bacterium]|nr:YeeE/YedE family protein [Paracoccaceae bacterium]
MIDGIADGTLVALVGLAGGVLLGLAARLGQFCTLGAVEDLLYQGSDQRMRMWGIAIGVAMLGSFGLIGLGYLPAEKVFYLSQAWNPLASILGGMAFGYGMALSGNCGYGILARLGGGDLRAFVLVMVMGVAAYVTLSGPLAPIRVWLFPVTEAEAPAGLAHLAGRLLGISPVPIGLGAGFGVLALSLASQHLRASPSAMFWAAAVGIAIVIGWAGTAWVADQSFDAVPVVSHTFSSPIGETLLYVMTSSGSSLSFGIGSVAGVWTGAFVGSLIKGHFRWEACEDPRELRRQIFGAALMGAGAVVALGCTVGQGMSAFSVLSYSAPVTFLAIVAGAAIGLRQLIEGFAPV